MELVDVVSKNDNTLFQTSKEDALKRETLEAIGLKEIPYSLIGKTIYKRHVLGRIENHFFILYEIHADKLPILNHESENYRYFTTAELKHTLQTNSTLFGDAFHVIVKEFFKELLF